MSSPTIKVELFMDTWDPGMVQYRVRMAFQMSFPIEMVINHEQDIAELVAHRLRDRKSVV